MAYPSEAELLAAYPLLPWIDEHFLRPDPFAFRARGFRSVVGLVAEDLDVDANGVYLIGSGATGLSINPGKIADGKLKAFGPDSDLDLAVISEVHFETAWRELRRAAQPTLDEIPKDFRENLDWQRKRFFDGAILAHKLLPALSFGPIWQTALVRVAERVTVLLEYEQPLKLWIYRDYWSLRNYIASGIVKCKKATT